MLAIISKEIKSFFNTMLGFAFVGFYLLILGIYFYLYHFAYSTSSFQYVLSAMSIFFIIFIPVLTMKAMAEESKNKTDQLLLTSPLSVEKVVLGKYFGILSVYGIAIVITLFYPLIVGDIAGATMNYKIAYYSILGYFLLGASFLAIGLFISSLTDSMVLSAVVTFVVVLLTIFMNNFAEKIPNGNRETWIILSAIGLVISFLIYLLVKDYIITGTFAVIVEATLLIIYIAKSTLYDNVIIKVVKALSVSAAFENFIRGNFNLSDIVYYLSIISVFVFLTMQMVKKKRWN